MTKMADSKILSPEEELTDVDHSLNPDLEIPIAQKADDTSPSKNSEGSGKALVTTSELMNPRRKRSLDFSKTLPESPKKNKASELLPTSKESHSLLEKESNSTQVTESSKPVRKRKRSQFILKTCPVNPKKKVSKLSPSKESRSLSVKASSSKVPSKESHSLFAKPSSSKVSSKESHSLSGKASTSKVADSKVDESNDKNKTVPLWHDNKLPKGWRRKVIQRQTGKSAGKYDVYIINPDGKKFRSRLDLQQYFKKTKVDLNVEDFDFTIRGKANVVKLPSARKRSRPPKKKEKVRPVVINRPLPKKSKKKLIVKLPFSTKKRLASEATKKVTKKSRVRKVRVRPRLSNKKKKQNENKAESSEKTNVSSHKDMQNEKSDEGGGENIEIETKSSEKKKTKEISKSEESFLGKKDGKEVSEHEMSSEVTSETN